MSVLTPPGIPVARTQIPPPITPDDLLKLDGLCELVDGEILEKGTMGFRSGVSTFRLALRLGEFLDGKEIGAASCETTFQCFPQKPSQVRRPDISFIVAARLGDVPDDSHVPIRPDLVVEVVSPSDRINDLEDRLADFRSVGVPLIWIVYPHSRIVRIFRPGERIEELTEAEELRGESILPGFSAALRDIFPSPASLMK
jgi:Uma2 family endonuclease